MAKKKLPVWPCPECGHPTRNTKTKGNETYKKCDWCGANTRVELSPDHTKVVRIIPKWASTKTNVDKGLQAHIQACMETEEKPKLLKLKQKEKDTGIHIDLDPNYKGSMEDIEAGLKKILGL